MWIVRSLKLPTRCRLALWCLCLIAAIPSPPHRCASWRITWPKSHPGETSCQLVAQGGRCRQVIANTEGPPCDSRRRCLWPANVWVNSAQSKQRCWTAGARVGCRVLIVYTCEVELVCRCFSLISAYNHARTVIKWLFSSRNLIFSYLVCRLSLKIITPYLHKNLILFLAHALIATHNFAILLQLLSKFK